MSIRAINVVSFDNIRFTATQDSRIEYEEKGKRSEWDSRGPSATNHATNGTLRRIRRDNCMRTNNSVS